MMEGPRGRRGRAGGQVDNIPKPAARAQRGAMDHLCRPCSETRLAHRLRDQAPHREAAPASPNGPEGLAYSWIVRPSPSSTPVSAIIRVVLLAHKGLRPH